MIILPEFVYLVEGIEVDVVIEWFGVVVVESALAVELIVDPRTFISFVVGLIVKSSLSLHFVILPLSVVKPTVLIIKLTSSMPHSIQFVALVLAPDLEMLSHILRLGLNLGSICNFTCFRQLVVKG